MVHVISALKLPWICLGNSSPSSSLRARNLMTTNSAAPITSTPTTPATMNTGTARWKIWKASGPSGLNVSCGALLAQPTARNSSPPTRTVSLA
jgi:hypothetical protein